MKITSIPHTLNAINHKHQSNVNFKAKLLISDDFLDTIDKEMELLNNVAKKKGQSIENVTNQFRNYIYNNLSNLGKNIERLEPKNMAVTLDLSDEYKEYLKTGNSVIDFEAGHETGYYKMCELRFGTKEQQKALRQAGGRAVFDFQWSNLEKHLEILFYATADRLNFFR